MRVIGLFEFRVQHVLRAQWRVLRHQPTNSRTHQLPNDLGIGLECSSLAVSGARHDYLSQSRDPADDKFLECAMAGEADYLVSADADLPRWEASRVSRS